MIEDNVREHKGVRLSVYGVDEGRNKESERREDESRRRSKDGEMKEIRDIDERDDRYEDLPVLECECEGCFIFHCVYHYFSFYSFNS